MNEQPLISVIVPVYNSESMLEKCVDSICRQTYSNLEIILVDDGSKDNSASLCDEYQEKDKRIIVIHKQNGGLSDARNAGLDIATGEYVGFIDSDDYIDLDMFEFLIGLILKYHAQIATCGWYEEFSSKTVLHSKNPIEVLADRRRVLSEVVAGSHAAFMIPLRLYNKDLFFSSLRFQVGMHYEDSCIFFKLLEKTDSMVISSVPKYHWVRYVNSITTSLNSLESFRQNLLVDKNNYLYVSENYPEWKDIYADRVFKTKYTVLCKLMILDRNTEANELLSEIRSDLLKEIKRLFKLSQMSFSSKMYHLVIIIFAKSKLMSKIYMKHYREKFIAQ